MQLLQSGTATLAGDRSTEPRGKEPFPTSERALYTAQRAALLRYGTQTVEIAKLPSEQRNARLAQLHAGVTDQATNRFIAMFAMSDKIFTTSQRGLAKLRCAIAATAAERCRLTAGNWPDGLDALKKAGSIPETLIDPYDGRPLRWRRLDDGVAIYAVGPDGEDDGGKFDRANPTEPGTDVGIRLWDVAGRRQQPASPKPQVKPERAD